MDTFRLLAVDHARKSRFKRHRFSSSFQDAVDLLEEHGITVDRSTVFRWVQKFAPECAKRTEKHLRRVTDEGSVANSSRLVGLSQSWQVRAFEFASEHLTVTIDFKGNHFPKGVILYAVLFYMRYGVTYRDPEEILAECGVEIDHATLNRRVVKFSPLIVVNAQIGKTPTAISWRMDETCIKVRGKWTYLYRAVDRDGQALDYIMLWCRDTAAARRFFKRAIGTNGVPDRIAIDKSGANLAGLQSLNIILKLTGTGRTIGIVQSKYLNNIVERDHRFIKRITRPMLGFKAFHSAAATLAGIETAHMIRKGRLNQTGVSACKQFAALAA